MHINLEKCEFFLPQVDYLGHTLSEKGISPNSDKIKAIVEAPSPSNCAQLQSYLGLLNYYSRFLPNASSLLRHFMIF